MHRIKVNNLIILVWIVALIVGAISQPAVAAKWTILVYMNGNNNLEDEININFDQMAKVGSSDEVNVLVQAARKSTRHVLRGRVEKDAPLSPVAGFDDLGDVDMGGREALAQFLQWGLDKYPANKAMVIIWNHGQGWRAAVPNTAQPSHPSTPDPYRAISYDDLHDTKLYNKDVQSVLENLVQLDREKGGLGGRKFDIVAFDACLMAMIETSYALRNSAELMVASEELVPGNGFPYQLFLTELTSTADPTSNDVARMLVRNYEDYYSAGMAKADPATTLSAVSVSQALDLAQSVSYLAGELTTVLPSKRNAILAARMQCPVYGPNSEGDGKNYFYHVDLGCIFEKLQTKVSSPAVQQASQRAMEKLTKAVLFNHIGEARKSFGSYGLAIYFPQTLDQYQSDVFAENGYEKGNKVAPVDFVKDLQWADFVHAILRPVDAKK